jgi:hypothetical protein
MSTGSDTDMILVEFYELKRPIFCPRFVGANRLSFALLQDQSECHNRALYSSDLMSTQVEYYLHLIIVSRSFRIPRKYSRLASRT